MKSSPLRALLFPSIIFLASLLIACEKEVEVDLPEAEQQLVVEGSIETGQPPFVILTKTQGYFEPTDINSFENIFVSGATIMVSNGQKTIQLTEVCTDELPASALPAIGNITGFGPSTLKESNICVYAGLDSSTFLPNMLGEEGKTYQLTVDHKDHSLHSSTTIPHGVPLDSLWFELSGDRQEYGLSWAILKDPDTLGNAYRWYAKREGQDGNFVTPYGSVSEDRFFNGQEFEFNYPRGSAIGRGNDESDDIGGLYQVGDTIVVKLASITLETYEFFQSFEQNQANTGSPFATPSNAETNIIGGLGIWAGYGVRFDTTIAQP